jgi:hypothetical protein
LSNFEKVQSNWSTLEKLLSRLEDENINNMLDELGERLAIAPASQKTDQVGCFPGGLVQHALDVTISMKNINESLGFDIPINSILRVGLLHEIGKLGNLEHDLFVEQESDWHREKLGQMYKFNEDLDRMSTSHRTLYLLQHFGVKLSSDEWIAIQVSQGTHFEENRFYVGHEPKLAALIHMAKTATSHL